MYVFVHRRLSLVNTGLTWVRVSYLLLRRGLLFQFLHVGSVGFHAAIRARVPRVGVRPRDGVYLVNSYFTSRVNGHVRRTKLSMRMGPFKILCGPLDVSSVVEAVYA